MIQVITAPSLTKPTYTSVFLAGGISNCRNWQEEVIEELKKDDKDMSVFNPRQKDFNIKDKNASYKQIKWEFERLQAMDIFSMYFCNSDSDQPICLYELGRYILHIQNKFPSDWKKRIVISVEKGYSRSTDVRIQLGLCAPNILVDTDNISPITHAARILARVRDLRRIRKNEDIKMDYEEKRELRKQISQLLADAGLNQGRLKEIVEEEIRHKVDRVIEQTLASLDAQSRSGSYIIDTVNSYFSGTNNSRIWYNIESSVKEELKKRVINITLQKVDIDKED